LYITLYSKVVDFWVIQFCFPTLAVADAIIVLFSPDFYFSSERGRRREGVYVCVCERKCDSRERKVIHFTEAHSLKLSVLGV